MTIVLKGVPPSGNRFNGRMSAWAYREEKKLWTNAVYLMCKACPDRPAKPWKNAAVVITYYFADARRHDPDNYCGKLLLDGLTQAGVIEDDSFDHISLTLMSGGVCHGNPHTKIEVVSS